MVITVAITIGDMANGINKQPTTKELLVDEEGGKINHVVTKFEKCEIGNIQTEQKSRGKQQP
jgi:hypothetical protein